MNEEIITPEVMPQEALQVITESGVEQSTAAQIKQAFLTMFQDAEKWASQAKSIVVTDISQSREMKLARECRLALREIRCNAETARKRLKQDALAKGKAIDGIANVLKALVEPLEAHLKEQEEFKDRYEAEQKRQIAESRRLTLQPYAEVITIDPLFDLSLMPQDQFDSMLAGAKMQLEAKKREKAIMEASERTLAAMKEAQEKAQREATEALRREEERIMREKEEKQRKEREEKEAIDRANRASDGEKLLAFAAKMEALKSEFPELKSDQGNEIKGVIFGQIDKFTGWITSKSKLPVFCK